jgi:hypothetical protein
LQQNDAELLREALLNAARDFPDQLFHRKTDHHGNHYLLAFEMSTTTGTAIIRSIWIAPTGKQDVLRFISCYLE